MRLPGWTCGEVGEAALEREGLFSVVILRVYLSKVGERHPKSHHIKPSEEFCMTSGVTQRKLQGLTRGSKVLLAHGPVCSFVSQPLCWPTPLPHQLLPLPKATFLGLPSFLSGILGGGVGKSRCSSVE